MNNCTNSKSMMVEIIGSLRRGISAGDYPTEQLLKILIKMKDIVNFCNCSMGYEDRICHECNSFGVHNDTAHTPQCSCCQRVQFFDMLGVLMDQLSQDNRLPAFDENHLSRARIRDRTFNLERDGSKLFFQILRHSYAFQRAYTGNRFTQSYSFDFKTLDLEKS